MELLVVRLWGLNGLLAVRCGRLLGGGVGTVGTVSGEHQDGSFLKPWDGGLTCSRIKLRKQEKEHGV